MKVKMKETIKGSKDGIKVEEFEKGKTVDLPESLAKPWIDQKIAVAVGKKKVKEAPENKAEKEAPENKAQ